MTDKLTRLQVQLMRSFGMKTREQLVDLEAELARDATAAEEAELAACDEWNPEAHGDHRWRDPGFNG